MSNLARQTVTWIRLDVQHFTSIDAGDGNAAPKYQKIPLFGSLPGGANPLTDF